MAGEHPDCRDERIGRILNEYLDRARRGEPVSEAELLEANPDLADELREHFGMVRHVKSSRGEEPAGAALPPPDALPGYEILGEIHRGGQGVVYEAMQKATRRRVAIKIMREGPFAGWRDRARFDREVQVLGALKHPSIVTIHDSGIASGSQFFVMDYIAGAPLDAWLAAGPRSIDEILRLFLQVCDAVNAAHLKGIIHRDLKPGNIRVDDEGRPQILDFGLAKVAGADQERNTAGMTVIGQFVGSLPWTSPEQVQGTLEQVDTRTDVYALGVILYQMLTGTFPYDVAGPMRDVLNRIVSSEPVPPSSLRSEIDRDLEAIVLRCLQKEPQRRYQTAGELARDIERYRSGQPVAARGDSGWYLLAKTLRRYRVPVTVAAAFAALVGISLLASLSLWRQAVLQRDRAVAARQEQDRQRRRADEQAAEARQARIVAENERTRAEQQAEQLRRTSYLGQIALARSAWEQKYLTRAEQILAGCDPDLRGWEWSYLWRLCRRATLLDIRADSECVRAMALSPDGRRLVTAGCDGVLRLWDSTNGDALARFEGHRDQVNTVAFSPDGQWIASGGRDKTLRLWDARTGSPRILQKDAQYIHCVRFSPDGKLLVAAGQSRTLTFWDVASGALIRTTPAQEKEISCVAWSPDGRHVVCGELLNPFIGRCRIRVLDAATGESIKELAGPPGAVLSVAYSPDGRLIAAGGGMAPGGRDALGTLKLFDAGTGEERLSLRGHEGFVDALAFSPDGKLLATAGFPRTPAFGMEADRTLKVWDVATGTEQTTYSAHSGGGRAVAWSTDGTRIFSAGMDGRCKVWPSSPPPEARVLYQGTVPVRKIALGPDGKHLVALAGRREAEPRATASMHTVHILDLATGQNTRTLIERQGAILGLAWSPDGRYIACGLDRNVRIWERTTGVPQLTLAGADATVEALAFNHDGTMVGAVAGYAAVLWTVPGGREFRRLSHTDMPSTIAFSSDSHWLATTLARGEIRLWDLRDPRESRAIPTDPGLNGAWFSPDSTHLASAHTNGVIALWDVATGERVTTMFGSQRSVEWLDFSPDGRRLASCTADMMLRVWDVASGGSVYDVRAHDGPVLCVRFSPDGLTIATCGQDGAIKLWEGSPGPTTRPSTSPQDPAKNGQP